MQYVAYIPYYDKFSTFPNIGTIFLWLIQLICHRNTNPIRLQPESTFLIQCADGTITIYSFVRLSNSTPITHHHITPASASIHHKSSARVSIVRPHSPMRHFYRNSDPHPDESRSARSTKYSRCTSISQLVSALRFGIRVRPTCC